MRAHCFVVVLVSATWRQVAAYWNYHLGQVLPCEHPQTLYVVCVLDNKHDTMPDEVRRAFPGWNIKTMAVINEKKRVNFEPKFRRLTPGFCAFRSGTTR